MKYMLRRWSNSSGGPGGVPSYTGATVSAGGAAGGNNEIQYNSGGLLAANSNFKIDVADSSFDLNGLKQQFLSAAIAVTDNIAVPTPLFTYVASGNNFAIIEYSIIRSTSYRVGRLMIVHNGITPASVSDDFVETSVTGVSFTADISGANVRVLFTSTNTGINGSLKYSMRRWS
jgi:hypothetical protein